MLSKGKSKADMRLLITGGSGLLGSRVTQLAIDEYQVFACYNKSPIDIRNVKAFHLDVTSEEEVLSLVKKISPQVIIHTAAFTDVDGCEIDKDKAYKVNIEGTRDMALGARRAKAKLIYLSADYVFDGEKGLYKEEDKPNPISYYGSTKLQGGRGL